MDEMNCSISLEQNSERIKVNINGNEMMLVAMICMAMKENENVRGIMEKVMPVYEMGNKIGEIFKRDKPNDD